MIGSRRSQDAARAVTVRPAQVHEGIGNALRQTFSAGKGSLPSDMQSLLDRLN